MKTSEHGECAGIFTAVSHDGKTYCLDCFMDSGGDIKDAEPLDIIGWDEVPPKCSLCFKEHTEYTT